MRVGIWIRVSTERQARGESPEHHLLRARAYAETKGWDVVEVYQPEGGVSGAVAMQHPEMQRMLADLKAGHIVGLIFSKLARLARSTKALIEIDEIFRAKEAVLVSLDEQIDTSTPVGRMIFRIIASNAEWEREEIGARVRASIDVRAQLGRFVGGPAPFGWRWVDSRLEPHPEEAAVVRLIFEKFWECQRRHTVANWLREQGYTARKRKGQQKPFNDAGINRILREPMHKGLRLIRREKTTYEHTLPAIVEPELWQRCNQLLTAQDEKMKAREKRGVYLFSGLLRCHCQSKLYAESTITPGRAYRCINRACRNSIRFVDLEQWFYERFTSFFCSPEAHRQQTSQTTSQLADKELLLQSCRQQLGRLGRELEKIRSAFLEADDPAAASLFVRHETEYAARRQALETQIATLEGELDALRLRSVSAEQGLSMAQTLALTWPELTPAEQRRIIEQIVDGILIGKTEGELHLAYLPEVFEFAEDSQMPSKLPAKRRELNNPPETFKNKFSEPLIHVTLTAPLPTRSDGRRRAKGP